jgi:hypothetical protein
MNEVKIAAYVIGVDGNPLTPTHRAGKVRRWLKTGLAKVVKRRPFTIQLLFETSNYVPDIELGVDSGYLHVGISATTKTQELFSADVTLLDGMVERNKERQSYRKTKRNRLRYRAPRFNNRKRDEGWLAPSIQHKFDSHLRIINLICSILPIKKTTIEVAAFDTQKIMDPTVDGLEYQNGVQKEFYNLREYILHRDGHKCQNPDCKNKDKNPILVLHHIIYQSNGGPDAPWNLITLCDKCHTPANHKGFLLGWKPKIKPMKAETFMSIVRWKLVNALACAHTFGYMTKSVRINEGIPKSHTNDAFVIASGNKHHARIKPFIVQQVRRNNRSLEKFYDAKYIDSRTGEKVLGKDLFSGRTKRNKNKNGENLRVYRRCKISKGRRSIRKSRYNYQPMDLVLFENKHYYVAGSQNEGAYVKLKDLKKVPKATLLRKIKSGKGFFF